MASICCCGSEDTVPIVSAGISTAGRSINSCVFFICTAGFARGSDRMGMCTVSFLGSLESAIGGSDVHVRRCPTPPILSLPKFRETQSSDGNLREQIVTACSGDSLSHEFADWGRFRQNHACVHVRRIRFGSRDQRLIDEQF